MWNESTSVGYLVNYVTLTFDLTHDLDLWFFKVKFQNSCIWGIVIWLMKRKGCELIIHDHDCDLWVTMVGWVDVLYSDLGDFRRRRAVDISSSVGGLHDMGFSWDTECRCVSTKLRGGNREYHPGGHYWDFYPGVLSWNKVATIYLMNGYP